MFKKKIPPGLPPTTPPHLDRWNRQRSFVKRFADAYGGAHQKNVPCKVDDPQANLIRSTCQQDPSLHAPVIDLDLPCELVPSKTPGHYHLYIDKLMSKDDFFKLLDVMAEVGIVEQGYVDASKRAGFAAVRTPGILGNEISAEVEAAKRELNEMLHDLET